MDRSYGTRRQPTLTSLKIRIGTLFVAGVSVNLSRHHGNDGENCRQDGDPPLGRRRPLIEVMQFVRHRRVCR
jgi:hypothetical protein